MSNLWNEVERLKDFRWIDLSHGLNDESPYWGGMPDGVREIGKTVYDYDQELRLRIQTFKFPGQFGTHIDYPGHFVQSGKLSDQFGIKDLVFPLIVIDVSEKVKQNSDYELTLADIAEHEKKYGRIPEHSFVALRTDWSKRWPDEKALSNLDSDGNEHCPGWTVETLKFLFDERNVAGNGHETLDTDASVGFLAVGDLVSERFVLERGKIQVELLTNLDQVPPVGAVIFIASPNIEGATGLPARVWAITE
ncbi:cyclase family protein [Sporolactobacillus pectinivorans]|uniref:cyclase family protein n=1 Tax=Sporolactobacillus pectinivorans TaxID=1591408 RepID=UPI000C266A11|nr:cyclase family protein [Sporolactobacillus pectinivorans]